MLGLGLAWAGAPATAQAPSEARVKARLAFNIARFTQWPLSKPGSGAEAFNLGVMHRLDPILSAFQELDGLMVSGRPFKVHQPTAPFADLQVVFVSESVERVQGPLVFAMAPPAPVLTVSDAEGFVARGGMVELVLANDAMRFDVNLKAVRAAGLALNSYVLKLARHVRE